MNPNIFYCIALAACGLGQYLDCHTTDVALAHGFVEANPWAVKIQAHIGQGGFFALKCMAIPGIGATLFITVGLDLSLAWLIPMAVIGWVAGIQNYLLLKKNHIKVF